MSLVTECCLCLPIEGSEGEYGHDNGEIEPYGRCSKCKEMAMLEHEWPVCKECGQERPDDERVLAGMKCGPCAYGVP